MAHYHFIGIGGIGMGKLASLLLSRGDQVSGSDMVENAMVESLRIQGATIFHGHDAGCLGRPDCVVYSSAIRSDNPELAAAQRSGCRILKRAQLLAELMRSQHTVTVAGAHGKTTTTSMIAHVLMHAGLAPTVALGGVFQSNPTYAEISGSGKYFVAELDESDGSFLYFFPNISVLTNIDFEHVDYYQNWDNIISAYRQFVRQTDPSGLIIGCGDDIRVRELLDESDCRKVFYGLSDENHLVAKNISVCGFGSCFSCWLGNECLGDLTLAVPGRHNVRNALAVVSVGRELGIGFDLIRQALESYHGVKRRFELKGQWGQIRLFDDYAHHPTEIRAVLETAREFSPKRLIAVFQPHRYTRLKFLKADFVKSFKDVDSLIVTDIYAASEAKIDEESDMGLLCQQIAAESQCRVRYVPKADVCRLVVDMAEEGDMIMMLGAGDVTKIADCTAAALDEKLGVNHV